mgnify:CR=1 FL=1
MIIVPLGVASATPTATRHLSSVAVWREGQQFLFDCGENAQMRMLQAGMKRSNVDYVFISHFDIDHYTGLIGLLATFQLQRRNKPVTLVGPEGLKKYVEWNLDFSDVNISYEIKYVELEEGFDHQVVVDEAEFYVKARPLDHTKFSIGYRLQEKDKPGKVDAVKAKASGISEDWQYKELKAGNDVELENGSIVKSDDIVGPPKKGDSFAYCSDTRYCENAMLLGRKTSVLYHESTFGDSLKDKAKETGHSTAKEAARIAREAETDLLVIAHFSARYTNQFVLLREARDIFKSTWVATELRPIMTDLEQERGIIQKRVELKDLTNKSKSYNSSGRSKKKRKRKKKRVKRSRRKKKETTSRKKRPRRSSSSKLGDKYESKSKRRSTNKKDSEKKERKPKHITPRTPFDDFDRF